VKDRQTWRASSGHFSEQPIASGRLNSVSFPAIVHSSKGIGHQAPTRVMGEAASNYVGNFRKFVSPPNVNSRSDPLNLLTLLYYGKIHMYLTLLKAFTSKTINSLFSSQHSYLSRVPKTFDLHVACMTTISEAPSALVLLFIESGLHIGYNTKLNYASLHSIFTVLHPNAFTKLKTPLLHQVLPQRPRYSKRNLATTDRPGRDNPTAFCNHNEDE
jgi:hypothetical protein